MAVLLARVLIYYPCVACVSKVLPSVLDLSVVLFAPAVQQMAGGLLGGQHGGQQQGTSSAAHKPSGTMGMVSKLVKEGVQP